MFSSAETNPENVKSQSFVDSEENYAIFLSVLDTSLFNSPFHYILRAERSAYVFQLKPSPETLKSQSLFDFYQNYALLAPVIDFSTFDHPFHSILHAECSAYVFQRQNKPRKCKIAIIRQF